MSKRNALIGAVLVVIAVVALILLSGGEGDNGKITDNGNAVGKADTGGNGPAAGGEDQADNKKPPVTNPPVPTIVIGSDGEPEGGVAELSVEKGETVRFKVESVVADEIHVHGYDLTKGLEPGGAVSFEFPATIEGIFEAELEDRGEQILELRVEP